jgi:hypothetical protein
MPIDGEGKQRAWCCVHYVRCLSQAAQIDADLSCPCSLFLKSENAVHLRDIDGVKLLVMAILTPDLFDIFNLLQQCHGHREKDRVMKQAIAILGHKLLGYRVRR